MGCRVGRPCWLVGITALDGSWCERCVQRTAPSRGLGRLLSPLLCPRLRAPRALPPLVHAAPVPCPLPSISLPSGGSGHASPGGAGGRSRGGLPAGGRDRPARKRPKSDDIRQRGTGLTSNTILLPSSLHRWRDLWPHNREPSAPQPTFIGRPERVCSIARRNGDPSCSFSESIRLPSAVRASLRKSATCVVTLMISNRARNPFSLQG